MPVTNKYNTFEDTYEMLYTKNSKQEVLEERRREKGIRSMETASYYEKEKEEI